MLKHDKGTSKMQEIWNAIRIGSNSYLNRQLRTILPLIALLTVALFLSVYVVPPSQEAVNEFGADKAQIIVAIGQMVDELAAKYAAQREAILTDVIAMLQDLADKGFLTEAREKTS